MICLDWNIYGNNLNIFIEYWTTFVFPIITFNFGNLSLRVFCKYLQWQVLLNDRLRLDSQRYIFQKKKDASLYLFHKDVSLMLVYNEHTKHMNRLITN